MWSLEVDSSLHEWHRWHPLISSTACVINANTLLLRRWTLPRKDLAMILLTQIRMKIFFFSVPMYILTQHVRAESRIVFSSSWLRWSRHIRFGKFSLRRMVKTRVHPLNHSLQTFQSIKRFDFEDSSSDHTLEWHFFSFSLKNKSAGKHFFARFDTCFLKRIEVKSN